MLPAAIHEEIMPKSDKDNGFCLKKLRGFNWRVDLGILPSLSKSSTIDDLRRATADSRRSYASLRRRLLIDPHVLKNGTKSVDLEIDNPLSQNPDSTWGRFFRNAELEKTVDQDLSRLYPEHGSYFQTPGCQGMLRRILLLWCLKHPEYGYKQGMHELLAPLLYVLHVDVNHLSEVRKQYENYFADKFDGLSFHENDLTYNLDFKRVLDSVEGEIESPGNSLKVQSLDQLDAEIQTIVLLCDAYGAEGELGIVLSEKFMEHDAYCLFDALMNGGHGSVAMADFFSFSPAGGSHSGLPPVIEASAALYHLLSLVDSSLHSHLIELGVEPQYFALRWLRVLFGREFLLEDLLLIWDEIFAADNSKLDKASEDDPISMFCSHRGALIVAIAVSILLYLRSCLLATENATTCLQRLLNFPVKIDLRKLMAKAKSLQAVALDANSSTYSTSFIGFYNRSKSAVVRGHTLSFDSVPSKIPLNSVPDSYWEEKWRVLHNTEDSVLGSSGEQKPSGKKRWVEKAGQALSRTESDPSPVKKGSHRDFKPSVRRSLLEDLSCELGMDEDFEKACCQEESSPGSCLPTETVENHQDRVNKEFICTAAGRYVSGSSASENSSEFSDPCSLLNGVNEHENYLDKSSVGSNSSVDESDDHSEVSREEPTSRVSHPPTNTSEVCERSNEPPGKTVAGQVKQKISGNFQWFWKFRRSVAGEETSDKGSDIPDATKDSCKQGNNLGPLSVDGSGKTHACGKEDVAEQKVMGSLRNLGQSMLEHIQVIESVFQQERGQAVSLESLSKNVTVGKGQITALTALKELRKISNLLSEM